MTEMKSGSTETERGAPPAQLIDARIAALSDWSGGSLARIRALKQADSDVVET